MAEFPALPIWTDALVGDTHFLTPAQFGAYLRLLICAWRAPECKLPNEDAVLGRMVGDTKNWHRLKPVVMPFFTLGEDGFYRQKRLMREREWVAQRAEQQAAAGRASALKRKGQASTSVALPLQPNANETSTPIPIPIPIPKQEEIKSSGFGLGALRANGEEKKPVAWKGGVRVSIPDPSKRMERFMAKINQQLHDPTWAIILAATDRNASGHEDALALCKRAANEIGKGWPRNWPTDGKFFEVLVSNGAVARET